MPVGVEMVSWASTASDARSDDIHRRGERVLLVSMPFGALERPAISLGLLQAHCRRLDVACETRYLTFTFAERVGLDNYLWLCSDDVPYTAFAGDWLFTEALYGLRPYADAAYIDEILPHSPRFELYARARYYRRRIDVQNRLGYVNRTH